MLRRRAGGRLPSGAALLTALALAGAVSAQTPTVGQTPPSAQAVAMTPADILPPAPAWSGASERLIAKTDDPWITPGERSGLTRTATWAETQAYLRRLEAASPLVRIESFGRTAQGRELLAVVVSKDLRRGRPVRLDPAKPVLLAQAGIHSGEIDGKEAGLMLLRDIALRDKAGLLDRVNLVFVPVFNLDGHERISAFNRPNQRGPELQGWRTTAQNLNLNRDWAKADTPEMRAMLSLLQKYDPALLLDLHVTDGLDWQPDVTFSFEGDHGQPAYSPAIAGWMRRAYAPPVTSALSGAGHIPAPYLDPVDNADPAKGLFAGASSARYSTGYGDAAHRATVLLETHSLKPFRQRVLGTYVFVEASLKALGADAAGLRQATAADRAGRPASLPARFRPNPKPIGTQLFKPIASETYESHASGRKEVRWLGRAAPDLTVPLFSVEPTVQLPRPKAYVVPATEPAVIERLRAHGVRLEPLAAPATLDVEMLRAADTKLATRVDEGRIAVATEAFTAERRRETFPAGSVRVPTDQPLGDLAVLLLDPRSEDSLYAWGFFPGMQQRTEYIEGYAIAPLADRMLAADPALKAAFEAKLAADAAIKASPQARLQWFYERTPYYDGRYRLYPVGLER